MSDSLLLAALIIVLLIAWGIRRYYLHILCWYAGFPPPKFRIKRDKNLKVPMKDGTLLATDVCRPKTHWKYPVILVRTPYDKSSKVLRNVGRLFASQGYAFVTQDVRGKHGSPGDFYPYAFEALDGHQTVNWAGEAAWSNGKIALFGASYSGSTAWLAAKQASPYLSTILSMFTSQNTYSKWIENGMPYLKAPLFWLGRFGEKKQNREITHKSIEPVLWHLPVNELDRHLVHRTIPFYRDYLHHISKDTFWDDLTLNPNHLHLPVFLLGGWYDPFVGGTIEDFQKMQALNPRSRLVIGPWGHNPMQRFKEIRFGKNSHFTSFFPAALRWCDHWLKDGQSEKEIESGVLYYIMGKNEWRESPSWPPKPLREEKYYLSEEGLDLVLPYKEDCRCFHYNPRDPILFRGSYLLKEDRWIEAVDQRELLQREDLLFYVSQPMNVDVTTAGSIGLVLYFSTDAVDTDLCVKISDLHPNGKAINVTAGFLRLKYRDSLEHPTLATPGHIYEIKMTLHPTAYTFMKGHRIQLQVASSDFPVHDRNLNTGLSCESSIEVLEATQTLYSGPSRPSCLILPII